MKRILVVEREYGAGGGTIARRLSERLGWKLYDQAFTEEIAKLANASPQVCQDREERVDSWLYRLAKVFWRGSHERNLQAPNLEIVDADCLIALSQIVAERLAEEGQCVIVGRGAAYFLRHRTDTFCVFLYAPREFRYRRVLAGVKNEAEALELVDRVDEERRAFIRHYFNAEWPVRHLYHAMLNTAAGEEATVENILSLMERAGQTGGEAPRP
jgi:cytidylate kinase